MTFPPVEVFIVPIEYGARGYGAKVDVEHQVILIPYNAILHVKFSDVPNTGVTTVPREQFNALPIWEGDEHLGEAAPDVDSKAGFAEMFTRIFR